MAVRTPVDGAGKPLSTTLSALEASESRYRRLFETAQDAILILDADERPGMIMDANPFVINLLGYTLDELIGRVLWEIGLFADKARSQAAMERLQNDGYVRYEDIPLETKQGRRVPVEFVSNTYMVDGRTVIQCNIRDITERALAAHALRASEARYRRLFETAQDAILILEQASGKIMDANPFVIELLGYPLDELVGKELWEIGLFSDRQESRAAMARLQENGYIRYEDMPLETKRGQRVEVEFVSNSYMVGNLQVIQCNIRDITDRKWAEETARISSERFRFLAESMPIITFTATPGGRMDYCNRQLTEFTGLTCEELCAAGRAPFTHPDETEENERLWRHSIASGEPFQFESRFRRADGIYRWHLTRAAAMRDAGGIVIWVGSSTDIHDQKNVEETLVRQYQESEALSRAKDEFLATSSHELRTPLTSILGWSELLVTGGLDEATEREALDSIRQSARAQSRLIDDMLDVSRLLTGKLELNSEPVDVAAAVLLALSAITPSAERKNLTLEKSFERGALRVDGDPTRLQQIFWNILANAVKFTPDGGRIHIRLFSADSRIHIVVSDTGQGIGPQFLPRVFDSLSQERGSSTRHHGGLGLGLSIVRQLVQMHGGTVLAESPGEGKGATFTVSLPARELTTAVAGPAMLRIRDEKKPPANDAPSSIAGMRVLVVDDEAEMRKLISTILRAAGASVVTAGSAAEAFELLAAQSFDALVSDVAMPDEDGHSLTRRIRALHDDKSGIPAVAVTAYGGPQQRQLALSAGFDDYVKKPFAPQDLIRAVAGVARRAADR
jgi:PAS domain S-box-containing protein